MNRRMTNALYLSPEGDGVIDCSESGAKYQNQEITFKPDIPIAVSDIHLADYFGKQVSVTANGKACSVRRVGTGYAKEIVFDWNDTVSRAGLHIVVTGDAGADPPALPERPSTTEPASAPTLAGTIDAFTEMRAANATKSAGTMVVDGYVTSCNNFDYLQFARVDFGKDGATGFVAKVKGLVDGASIEIVLDSVSGDSIGTCVVPNPGLNPKWTQASYPIRKTTGVHDVFLKFAGSSPDDLMHLESLKFTRESSGQ
jgi:hypothetical protein